MNTRLDSSVFFSKKKILWSFVLFMVVSMVLTACWRNRFDFENLSTPDKWNPDVCAPVVHSKLSLKDILNDYDHNNLIVIDSTGFCLLHYWRRVFSQTAGELLKIPPQYVNTNLKLDLTNAGSYINGDYPLPTSSFNFSFTMPHNEVLTKCILNEPNGGYIFFNNINSNPPLNHDATINITIPQITKYGIPLSRNINYTANTPLSYYIDLSGYTIDFGGAVPNSLTIQYTITIHGNGGINYNIYNLSLNESFQVLSFHELYGDFKQFNFGVMSDTVFLRVFENNVYGDLYFENPSARVIATNSYGIPLQFTVTNFIATSPINGQVTLTGFPHPFDIPAPTLSQIGQTDTVSFTLRPDNSNVLSAVQLSPHYFIVDLVGITNPYGTTQNFVVDTNRLAINMQIKLPFYGYSHDFRLRDTMDFEFGDNMEMVEYLLVKVNTVNDFPVDGRMQIYFIDALDNVIDSLFIPEQQIVYAAPVGPAPDYKILYPVSGSSETRIDGGRLINLERTKRVVIYSKLNTRNHATNQLVKIYAQYRLEVRMAVRAKFKVNL